MNSRLSRTSLIIITLVIFTGTSCRQLWDDSIIKKQWYLSNNGEVSYITDSPDFDAYIFFDSSIDIDACEMWEQYSLRETNTEVIIAILDTGIDINHKALSDIIWINESETANDGIDNDDNGHVDDFNGYNFCKNIGDITNWDLSAKENSHGTICAGIIAATNNCTNKKLEKPNIKIMGLKVLDSKHAINSGNVDNIVKAIIYAENQGAKICNLSLNIDHYNMELESIMNESNMLFIISSGNNANRGKNLDSLPMYPASYNLDNVITVANLNYNGKLNKGSNFGQLTVDIAAPGTCIYSTDINNNYIFSSGTSMSSALVTGVAALLYTVNGKLEPQEVKRILLETATPLHNLKYKIVCGGYVNGANALRQV